MGPENPGTHRVLTRTADGLLYGGNAGDGQLFELNPATRKVKNLGKPAMMNRLRGLCVGTDGKLYGLSGALPGYVHLFSYSPSGEGFTDLGNPQFILKAPGIEQGIEWRGFQLSAIAASEDGKYIVMGEDEALSQLLIFPVDSSSGNNQRNALGCRCAYEKDRFINSPNADPLFFGTGQR